jgi:hypothetical protein
MIGKKKKTLLIWIVTILCALVFQCMPGTVAAEGNKDKTIVSGVEFDNVIVIGSERLVLKGAGLLRYMVVMRGYVAALYLGEGHGSEELFDDIPKCLQIDYFHNIPAKGFIKATQYGLEANLSTGELERLRPQIDRLYACYKDIKKRDRYSFIYIPATGPELVLNGETLCRFDNLAFANAVLSIWLGRDPLDEHLKLHLLGGE